MARVTLTDPAIKDFEAFDNSAKKAILLGLKKLEIEPLKRGIPLSGNLQSLRRVVVGKNQIRILYTVSADEQECEIFLIGARRDDEVYKLAATRLGKLIE